MVVIVGTERVQIGDREGTFVLETRIIRTTGIENVHGSCGSYRSLIVAAETYADHAECLDRCIQNMHLLIMRVIQMAKRTV